MLIAVAAGELLALRAMAAPPPCGRAACREEIRACVDSECEGVSGSAHADCRRACVDAVQGACDVDPTVCNPSATTTSEPTTTSIESTTSSSAPSTTSTTLLGSPSGVFVD